MTGLPASGMPYDLAIIGGGINGCGIARDAAGRGWRSYLCEQGDLGGRNLRRVHQADPWRPALPRTLRVPPGARGAARARGAVADRAAHHLAAALRAAAPAAACARPGCCGSACSCTTISAGAGCCRRRARCACATTPRARPLKPEFARGFEYSDCWVEDCRLVVLNARDAADRGADIAPRTPACRRGAPDGLWRVSCATRRPARGGDAARALVNAAGPWVAEVLGCGDAAPTRRRGPARQGQPHRRAAALRRRPLLHPAERRRADHLRHPLRGRLHADRHHRPDFAGDPAEVARSRGGDRLSVRRRQRAISRGRSTPEMWCGPTPACGRYTTTARGTPQAATRDYVLELDAPPGAPPLLNVFGGKITTYRRLAEAALGSCRRICRRRGPAAGWTGSEQPARRRFSAGRIRGAAAAPLPAIPALPRPRCAGCCAPMARGVCLAGRRRAWRRPRAHVRRRPDGGGTAPPCAPRVGAHRRGRCVAAQQAGAAPVARRDRRGGGGDAAPCRGRTGAVAAGADRKAGALPWTRPARGARLRRDGSARGPLDPVP